MSKLALSMTFACLFVMVAVARGDKPAAVPAQSKPTQAQAIEATPAASANSQPESAAPIVIETTPDLDRSEVIGKLVTALEKEGIAKRSDQDRAGKPVDFRAAINARPDMPGDKIRTLIETLKALSIGSARIQLIPADGVNDVIVTCPADVTYQRVRTLQETLAKQDDFKVDVRVAANIGPVASTGPTMFTVPLPQNPLAPITRPAAAQGNGGEFGHGLGGFGGMGSVALGLPASAIPGRKWVAGTKVIVTFSDDGKQVLAYSEQHPRWVAQDLEQLKDFEPIPVVGGGDNLAVRVGHLVYAYSATLGKWDVLKLPLGEAAVPTVSDDGVGVHSASQGDFVFKDSWGKWFSTDEIKAGSVAEHLLAQRNSAPLGREEAAAKEEITVFPLKYIQAGEAFRIVKQLYGLVVKRAAADERTNSLIVASSDPSALSKVKALLQAIDTPSAKNLARPQPVQSVDDLRQLHSELEQRTRELSDKLRAAGRPAEAEFELREAVKKAFEARQNLQRAELADFTQRLQGIQQSIEMRDRISQQIIDRRVEELLDPNLRWDDPAMVSENHVPAGREDDQVTHGNLPKSTPPADQSSSRYAGGKPLKAFVRIAFDKRQLGKIDWLAGPGSLTVDGFGKGHIVTSLGSTTSLRLTDLPGRDNAAMFVTLQIMGNPSSYLSRRGVLNPVELLAHNPIPLQITDKDCDRVLSGEFVTKWIYLPHDLSTAGESIFKTLDSSRSEAGSMPIGEVEKLGVVVAILRLSKRAEPLEVVPPMDRPHDSSPRTSVRTLPDDFVCWELFGAKFRKVVDELADIPFHSQGLQIVELRPNSPAEKAGLRAGDIVVIVDIRSVGEISHVKYALQEWQDSGLGKRARQVTFVRGNETRRAFVDWLETPTTRSGLDYEYGLALDVRETLMRELVELEPGNSDVADDGKDTGQAAEGVAAAGKSVQIIAAVKSKLEEVEERLRVLARLQAILQEQANVSPDSIPDSDRAVIPRAVVVPAQATGSRDTPAE